MLRGFMKARGPKGATSVYVLNQVCLIVVEQLREGNIGDVGRGLQRRLIGGDLVREPGYGCPVRGSEIGPAIRVNEVCNVRAGCSTVSPGPPAPLDRIEKNIARGGKVNWCGRH